MTEQAKTITAVDAAIRAHAEPFIDDGEVIVTWIVAAATRNYRGGGAVVTFASDSIPQWEARGVLTTALRHVDRVEEEDQDDEGDNEP